MIRRPQELTENATAEDSVTGNTTAGSTTAGSTAAECALPKDSAQQLPQGIIVAATPLGNLGDASPRLVMALQQAHVIAAEDTRRLRNLANALGVELRAKVISNFDHNEAGRVEELLRAARNSSVLVVSDAGMPVVSDPGHNIVAAAHDAGISVTAIPGPSAVPTALALSGLQVGKFIFDSFAPRKDGARRSWLESFRSERRAVCFFESPHRLADTLHLAAEILGPERRGAVCRELTKLYEEVRRAPLGELADWAEQGVKGEITVVIEGGEQAEVSLEDALTRVQELVDGGLRLKAACKQVGMRTSQSNRELYDAYLRARDGE